MADSPLRDRVVFVTGSARSGTTWLATVLSVHPDIAGTVFESHLFDRGVDRLFDNHAGHTPEDSFLTGFVSHEELVDLVRELCDGILTRMHARTKPEARLVLEKTPVGAGRPLTEMQRKLECYPDARYVHIVRDGEAVADSLMRTPWMEGRSRADCRRVWAEAVEAIRETLDGHPGYFELSYEDLRADTRAASGELLRWLGVDAGDDVLERVTAVSRQHHAPWQARHPVREATRARRLRRRLPSRVSGRALLRAAATRAREPRPAEPASATPAAVQGFYEALRTADAAAMAAAAADPLELTIRSPHGDLHTRSADALPTLVAFAEQVFAQDFLNMSWASSGQPDIHGAWFSGTRRDASRVDLSVTLKLTGDRISEVALFSAGDPAGRLPGEWRP